MIKHTQTIWRQQSTNCLSVFDHFVGLALKGLTSRGVFMALPNIYDVIFYARNLLNIYYGTFSLQKILVAFSDLLSTKLFLHLFKSYFCFITTIQIIFVIDNFINFINKMLMRQNTSI